MAQTKLNVVEDTIETQIAELRSQIDSLTKSVSARAGNFSESAAEVVGDASGRVRKAAQNVREQGYNVVEAVKENPGTATSLLTTVGVIGFALGYFIANSSSNQPPSRWRLP
jgi:gas vesicle protein